MATLRYSSGGDSWWPRASDDGQYVVAGNETLFCVRVFDGAVFPMGPGRAARWIGPRRITFLRTIDDTHAHRYEVDAEGTNLTAISGEDVGLVAGNDFEASRGHWASWLAAGSRLAYDNRLLLAPSGGVRMAGDLLLAPRQTDFVVFRNGQQVRTVPRPAPANDYSISSGGLIGYGYFGPTYAIDVNGGTHDISVTPWKQEGVAQFVYLPDGDVWVWTHTVRPSDQKSIVLGRPWSESHQGGSCVAMGDFPAVALSVVWDGRQFIVAGCSATGAMQIHAVARDAARKPVTDIVAPPSVPVLDTSGAIVDLLPYLLPEPAWQNRTGTHDLSVSVTGTPGNRRMPIVKFGDADHWDLLTQDGDAIRLWEDHSQSEPGQVPPLNYSFTDDLWLRRYMKPGDVIRHDANWLVRFDPATTHVLPARSNPFPYNTQLVAVYTSYPCGGDVATRKAIEVEYLPLPDSGGRPERNVYVEGVGLVIWRLLSADRKTVLNESIFNRVGGRALAPTPGSRDAQTVWPPVFIVKTDLTIDDYYPRVITQGEGLRLEYLLTSGLTPAWVEWWIRVNGVERVQRNAGTDHDHTWTGLPAGTHPFGLRWPQGATGNARQVVVTASAPPPLRKNEMTFEQFAQFRVRMEQEYSHQHPSRQVSTFTDDGVDTWWRELLDRMARGESYDQAERWILHRIREIEGRPQEPGDVDPNPGPGPGPDPGPSLVRPLQIDGTHFRTDDGAEYRFQGVAGFAGFQLWLDGDLGQLDDFAGWMRSIGANAWLFFCMWTQTGFDPRRYGARYYDEFPRFLEWLEASGFRPYPSLFQDQDSSKGSTIVMSPSEQDAHFAGVRPHLVGRVVRYMNEVYQNGTALCRRLPHIDGALCARGQFEDGASVESVGSVLDFSEKSFARKFQWARTSKDLYEVTDETGKPAVGGEPPLGIFEVLKPWSRSDDPRGFADWHGLAHLLGNGSFIHGDPENLQHCRIPGPRANACAEAIAAMWREHLPADGSYTAGHLGDCPLIHEDRYDDGDGEKNPSGALRTFGRIQGNRATMLVLQFNPERYEPRAKNGWRIVGRRGPHAQIIDCEQ